MYAWLNFYMKSKVIWTLLLKRKRLSSLASIIVITLFKPLQCPLIYLTMFCVQTDRGARDPRLLQIQFYLVRLPDWDSSPYVDTDIWLSRTLG